MSLPMKGLPLPVKVVVDRLSDSSLSIRASMCLASLAVGFGGCGFGTSLAAGTGGRPWLRPLARISVGATEPCRTSTLPSMMLTFGVALLRDRSSSLGPVMLLHATPATRCGQPGLECICRGIVFTRKVGGKTNIRNIEYARFPV